VTGDENRVPRGFSFAELDRDGALQEAADRLPGETRHDFLAKSLLGGGVAIAALLRPGLASAGSNDTAILNYALTLEYVQSSFYTEAERRRALTGEARTAARVLGSVERGHVKALKEVLGTAAVKKPFFNFQGVTEDQDAFLKTAVAFEDLAVEAYKGQAPRIESPAVLAAAVSIHSVEARHAAWMRYLVGTTPAGAALDGSKSMAQVLRIVQGTKFIVQEPATQGTGEPTFTG
jgi:rubrerythrin